MRQVVVIGAGPAGSVASILLARAGWRVMLVEQHRFPRDKVCGECLSALGIDVLHRLKLSLDSLNPIQLRRGIMFTDDAKVELPLPRPMLGISRFKLDEFLLAATRDAGVEVLQPYRCEKLNPLLLRDLETNELRTLQADVVVLADGKGALLPSTPIATTDFGLKAHFINVAAPTDAIELFGVQNHYGGIAPIEDSRWNIAFSVPESRMKKHGRNHDQLFAEMMSENRWLHAQMRGAKRISDWLICRLPRFSVMEDWPANVVPIGNAAAALEPIGGEGMGLAMASAELAANHLVAGSSLKNLRREYQKLWRLRSFACRAAARTISSPSLARSVAAILSDDNPISSLLLNWIGKSTA